MNPSFNTTPNFDNLLLQSLMGRLQIRSPPPNPALLSAKSLEDLLLNNLLADEKDGDPDDDEDDDGADPSYKSQLANEESKLEKEIIRTIHTGSTDSLKPNSGQAVTIGEHHICIGFHEDEESDYRVWEWHGHVILFDEENGYNPEYIYGNYFERVTAKPPTGKKKKKQSEEKEVEKVGNLGLRELIESAESNSDARILRRNNINAGSSNFLSGSS